MVHTFVSYTLPVTTTTTTSVPVENPVAPSDSIIPTVAANAIDSLKQLIFGAGAEPVPEAQPAAQASVSESLTTTETHYITQPCIMTTGETFAIWLNVLYLAPLTYLFMSFFIASYLKRSNAATKIGGGRGDASHNVALAEKAGWDAAKGLEKEVYGGESMVVSDDGVRTPTKKSNGKAKRRA